MKVTSCFRKYYEKQKETLTANQILIIKINSLRAPDKFLHAPKRNFFKPYSNESLCPKTQKNILCFIIESFVAMETLYELCKTDIWSRISVALNIVFFSKQELY